MNASFPYLRYTRKGTVSDILKVLCIWKAQRASNTSKYREIGIKLMPDTASNRGKTAVLIA